MRSFFLFIIRYHTIFLFVFLELISFWLVFQNNAYNNAYFINSANVLTGNVLNTYGNLTSYFYLRQVNDSLMNENVRLRNALHESKQFDTLKVASVKDSSGRQLYSYIPAEVINNSYTSLDNYITINRGSNDGIENGMGVITSGGIAGVVKSTSPHFSVLLSVLHSDFHTPVAVKRNNAQGRLIWDGKDPDVIKMVDVSEPGKLYTGDTITTTAVSQLFPPNTMVGTLVDYGKEKGSNFYTIDIKLSTNFSRLKYVYVINYLLKQEKEDLEKSVPNK